MATWLPVPGWEGLYEVSDEGQVRSVARKLTNILGIEYTVTGRMLTPTPNTSGYLTVGLSRPGIRCMKPVHTLVMLAFVGPRPDGLETCHNNGDKTNNTLANLRYDTHRSNVLDQLAHGTNPRLAKTHCPRQHPYSEVNTYRMPNGGRACRVCKRIRDRARYAAKKAAA